MKKIVFLLVFCAISVLVGSGLAIELNSANQMVYLVANGYADIDSTANASTDKLANAYLVWNFDSTDDFYIRRKFNITPVSPAGWLATWTAARIDSAQWEVGPGVLVPAGQSIIIPIPMSRNLADDKFVQRIQLGGAASDTIGFLPWVK